MAWLELDTTPAGSGVIWTQRDRDGRLRYTVTDAKAGDGVTPDTPVAYGQYTRAAAVREWLDRVNGTAP
jgi:hypothetical protein